MNWFLTSYTSQRNYILRRIGNRVQQNPSRMLIRFYMFYYISFQINQLLGNRIAQQLIVINSNIAVEIRHLFDFQTLVEYMFIYITDK